MNDPAAHTPPWEWNTTTIRALMKVRGDSAHTLAKDLYVVTRAVEGWLYNDRSPNPTSAKQLYRLWAELDPWQREVFDALRANPRQAPAVPTLDPPARTIANGDGTDRGQFCKLVVGGLASAPLEALERIAADFRRPGRIDTELVTAHEHWADLLAGRHTAMRPDVLLSSVAAHADTALELLDRPAHENDRHRLETVVVGSYAQAGLLAFSAGKRAAARRCFALARSVADDSGDDTLFAQASAVASILYSSMPSGGRNGDTDRAIRLLRRAAASARKADGPTQAWVSWWLAAELAAAGDEPGFFQTAEAAERLSEQPGHQDGLGFFARRFAVGPRLTSQNMGTGLVLIGRTEEAIDALNTATKVSASLLWPVIAFADIAAARVLQGEVEQACQGLHRALSLALTAGYVMGVERIFGVRAKFDPRWNDLACVRELDERLRAIPA